MWDLLNTNCPRTATIDNILWSYFLQLPPWKIASSLTDETLSFTLFVPLLTVLGTQHTFVNHLRSCQGTLVRRRAGSCLDKTDLPRLHQSVRPGSRTHPNLHSSWNPLNPSELNTDPSWGQDFCILPRYRTSWKSPKSVDSTGSEPDIPTHILLTTLALNA